MIKPLRTHLSRRESEIMDIVYRLGEASVSDVERLMSDSPGYNSVRVTLGILVRKKHLRYRREGRRYIYGPTLSREKATRFAMRNLLQTFFGGSPSKAILAMLHMTSEQLSLEELDQLVASIEKEKEKEK
jgi:predicted transcriptional regulator